MSRAPELLTFDGLRKLHTIWQSGAPMPLDWKEDVARYLVRKRESICPLWQLREADAMVKHLLGDEYEKLCPPVKFFNSTSGGR